VLNTEPGCGATEYRNASISSKGPHFRGGDERNCALYARLSRVGLSSGRHVEETGARRSEPLYARPDLRRQGAGAPRLVCRSIAFTTRTTARAGFQWRLSRGTLPPSDDGGDLSEAEPISIYEDLFRRMAVRGGGQTRGEWRVHFHVPIYLQTVWPTRGDPGCHSADLPDAKPPGDSPLRGRDLRAGPSCLPKLQSPDLAAASPDEINWRANTGRRERSLIRLPDGNRMLPKEILAFNSALNASDTDDVGLRRLTRPARQLRGNRGDERNTARSRQDRPPCDSGLEQSKSQAEHFARTLPRI